MKTALLITLTIVIWSCGRNDIRKSNMIDLLSSPESEMLNLSDLASNVEYIPIQTLDSSLIRYVYDLRTSNDKIFIYTPVEILCFNNKGQYLYKLDKQGRGPEEYQYISDFDLNSVNDLLIILITKKIVFYKVTPKGFVYSKSLILKDQPASIDFSPDQNNILLSYGSSYGNEPFRYLLINLDGDTLKAIPNYYKYPKNSKMMFVAKFENLLFKSDNSLNFKYWLSDTVFTLDRSNKITPHLILDSHMKHITTDALSNFSEETMSEYLQVNSIIETSRFLIYRFFYEKTSYFRVFDKGTNNIFGTTTEQNAPAEWLKDDISGGIDFEPKFCCDGILYSWVDALTLKKHIATKEFKNSVVKSPEKKKALEELTNSLDETDNPVLIAVTPKQ